MMRKLLVLAIGVSVAGATVQAEARGWRWFCWGQSAKPGYTSPTQQGARNFSVEPGGPVTRPQTSVKSSSMFGSGTPTYLLPKSDPRKHTTGF